MAKEEKKEKVGLEKMHMVDRNGIPLNRAILGNNPKKYGVMGQH